MPREATGANARLIRNDHTRNFCQAHNQPAREIALYLSTELAEKAEALYPEHLAREFGGHPVLDSITVEPTTDEDGEATFHVTVVYDGNEHTVDSRKAIRVLNALATPPRRTRLPMQGCVSKDEYPRLLDIRADALSGKGQE